MFFPAEFSHMYGIGAPPQDPGLLAASGTMSSGSHYSDYRYRGSGSVKFWFVVRLSGKDYADHLEEHPEIPMMIPTKGKFIGIARDQAELSKMTTDWKPESATNDDSRYVYLVYRIGMNGLEDMIATLEFFHKHGMLERES